MSFEEFSCILSSDEDEEDWDEDDFDDEEDELKPLNSYLH